VSSSVVESRRIGGILAAVAAAVAGCQRYDVVAVQVRDVTSKEPLDGARVVWTPGLVILAWDPPRSDEARLDSAGRARIRVAAGYRGTLIVEGDGYPRQRVDLPGEASHCSDWMPLTRDADWTELSACFLMMVGCNEWVPMYPALGGCLACGAGWITSLREPGHAAEARFLISR
jgi:hypothetical protein